MLSLSVKNIDDFVSKLGLDDFDTSNSSMDASGDFVSVLDPDTGYEVVRRRILNNKVVSKKIVNQGVLFTELFDTLWIDGYRVNIAILVECGMGKVGTKIKMMVKSLDALVNGQMKQFLSFESYKNYSELIQK